MMFILNLIYSFFKKCFFNQNTNEKRKNNSKISPQPYSLDDHLQYKIPLFQDLNN